MAFCKNCGKETNENDVYCASCGAKVNDEGGEAPAKTRKGKELLTDFANLLMGIVERPMDATKEFALKAEKETLILATAVLALLQGLLGLWRACQAMDQFEKFSGQVFTQFNQMNPILGKGAGSFNDLKEVLTVRKGAVFGQNILVYLLGMVILFAFIFVINAAFNKQRVSARKLYAVLLACSVPFVYGEILAIIMCYASVKIAAFILILGMLVSIACLVVVVREDILPEGEGAVWTVAIAEVLMIMVLSLVV